MGLAYRRLAVESGADPLAVAVRSSAVDEDRDETSFAGQHESYLNVIGEAAVVEAVWRCRKSTGSNRVLAYRRRHGMPAQGSVAVLVQRMVAADVSAVAFSADPVTGARGEVLIESTWGLGESLVGGTVNPDLYRVSKRDFRVACRPADKRLMAVLAPAGTREVEVPSCLRALPTLSDQQAVEIARLAVWLEREAGRPVDIECAYSGDRLYLLQCRPVSGLSSDAGFNWEETNVRFRSG